MAQAWLGAGLGEPEVPGYRGVRKALPSYQERVTANSYSMISSQVGKSFSPIACGSICSLKSFMALETLVNISSNYN